MSLLDDDEPCLQALLQNICCIQPAIPTRPHSRVRSVGEARDTDVASLTAAGYMRGAPLLLTCVAGSASGESKALPPMAWDAQTFDIGETCVAPPRLQLHRPNATALTVSAVGGGGAPDVWMGLNARDHGLSVAPCAVRGTHVPVLPVLCNPLHPLLSAADRCRPLPSAAVCCVRSLTQTCASGIGGVAFVVCRRWAPSSFSGRRTCACSPRQSCAQPRREPSDVRR